MSHAADGAVGLLQSLGNKSRLMIMCQLIDGEKSVGQLAELLQARESTVSQHLALLRKDRLVTTRRQGQTIFYAMRATRRAGCWRLFTRFIARNLNAKPGVLLSCPSSLQKISYSSAITRLMSSYAIR